MEFPPDSVVKEFCKTSVDKFAPKFAGLNRDHEWAVEDAQVGVLSTVLHQASGGKKDEGELMRAKRKRLIASYTAALGSLKPGAAGHEKTATTFADRFISGAQKSIGTAAKR